MSIQVINCLVRTRDACVGWRILPGLLFLTTCLTRLVIIGKVRTWKEGLRLIPPRSCFIRSNYMDDL